MAEKAGHTGSLDPFATGLLPLCMGEATKFSHMLLDADKVYEATLQLGATSTTGDVEGQITPVSQVRLTLSQVEETLQKFVGGISQVPPMYSALKHQGKALYEYARAGVEIERKSREITIHSIDMLGFSDDQIVIRVACSKGTYIRTLGEDIGAMLGCGAYLTQLRRIKSGGFALANALSMAELESMSLEQRDARLLPTDSLLHDYAAVILDQQSAHYFCQGQSVWKSGIAQAGFLRVYDADNNFIGLGNAAGDGQVAPRRLVRCVEK